MHRSITLHAIPALLLFMLLAPATHAQAPATVPAAATPVVLPPGVRALFAHEGDNTIIADATPAGYEAVRTLVRHLDGQLDAIRTEACLVTLTPALIKSAGLAVGASDAALLAAYQAGRLHADTGRVRLTTREDTPIGTLLRGPQASVPLSLVPREDSAGTLSVELLQPATLRQTLFADGTVLAHLSGDTADATHLLILTPTLVPSGGRGGQ